MSIENIEFLDRHIELVINICYGSDILNTLSGRRYHKDHRYYAYIDIVSRILNNSQQPKDLLLPNGGLEIIPRLNNFHHVTSWVDNQQDIVFETIMQTILHINARIVPSAYMPDRYSHYHEEVFSHIISIKDNQKEDTFDTNVSSVC